jgi:hypothetical protein
MPFEFECWQCKKPFLRDTRRRAHKYCSHACHNRSQGEPHPKTLFCQNPNCGREFLWPKGSHRARMYCSVKCQGEAHSARRPERPFPLQPLLDLIPREPLHADMRFRTKRTENRTPWYAYETKRYTLARWLMLAGWTQGQARGRVNRAAQTGLSFGQADEIACAVGYHPAEVWPEWRNYG